MPFHQMTLSIDRKTQDVREESTSQGTVSDLSKLFQTSIPGAEFYLQPASTPTEWPS